MSCLIIPDGDSRDLQISERQELPEAGLMHQTLEGK